MIYLSGVSNSAINGELVEHGVGLLVVPGNGYRKQAGAGFERFGIDNGMFGLAKRHLEHTFDAERFYAWLDTLPRTALFAAAPDVLHFVHVPGVKGSLCKRHGVEEIPVGDAAATLAQFPEHARRMRALGFKVALVAQDGLGAMLSEIPWHLVDAVFLGGSDAFKLGVEARSVTAEAKRRGKWVHMGRVNSAKRFRYASEIGCDSADGTFLAFGPTKNLPRLLSWLDEPKPAAAPMRRAA